MGSDRDFWVKMRESGGSKRIMRLNYMTTERDERLESKENGFRNHTMRLVPSINCFTPSPPTNSNLPDFSLLIHQSLLYSIPWSPLFYLSFSRFVLLECTWIRSSERNSPYFERNPNFSVCVAEQKREEQILMFRDPFREQTDRIQYSKLKVFLCVSFSQANSSPSDSRVTFQAVVCSYEWEIRGSHSTTDHRNAKLLVMRTQHRLKKGEKKMGGQKRETLFQPFLISFRHIVSVLEQTFNLLSRKEKASSTPHALLIIFRMRRRRRRRKRNNKNSSIRIWKEEWRGVYEVSGTLSCTHWLLPLFSRVLHNLCQSSTRVSCSSGKNFLENSGSEISPRKVDLISESLMRTECLYHD